MYWLDVVVRLSSSRMPILINMDMLSKKTCFGAHPAAL